MGAASGRNGPPLIEQLLDEGHRFDFFQAVRVIERWAAREAAAGKTAGRHPIGGDHAPAHEAVRLRTHVGLAFPAASVARMQAAAERGARKPSPSRPPEMLVTFLGLVGPHGVLPEHYTALLIERIRARDYALRDFLDLFQHRTLSLFYRAWQKYRLPVRYEQSQALGEREDPLTQSLYCLAGLGGEKLRRRLRCDDEAILYYAGLFAGRPRSATSLEQMVADYFQLPVDLRQFQGQWLVLSEEDRSLLPTSRNLSGQNNQLGACVVAGERVWDVQSKFRVRIGPLDYPQFRRFLPGGTALPTLGHLVRTYVGPQWDFDVQPVLRAAHVPWCRLGGDGKDASRLGWNTWVRNRPLPRDADQAVFVPKESYEAHP